LASVIVGVAVTHESNKIDVEANVTSTNISLGVWRYWIATFSLVFSQPVTILSGVQHVTDWPFGPSGSVQGTSAWVEVRASPGFVFQDGNRVNVFRIGIHPQWHLWKNLYSGNTLATATTAIFSISASHGFGALPVHITLYPAPSHSVVVNAAQFGSGTVTGPNTLQYGVSHMLTATPSTGFSFSHWTISGSGSLNSTTITNPTLTQGNGPTIITAHFTRNVHAVTVTTAGGGTVTGGGNLAFGLTRVLGATPAANMAFSHWVISGSGSLSSATIPNPILTQGNGPTTITAHFVRIQRILTIQSNPTYGGTTTGGGTVDQALPRNISATPNVGWRFVNWTVVTGSGTFGNVNSASTTFTIGTGNAVISANFERIFGQLLPPMENPPENWEHGWNLVRLHFTEGNATTALPGFDLNHTGSSATRHYDPQSPTSRNLPTTAQMNTWAATQPAFENRTFQGWYTNPNFTIAQGQQVTQIPAGHSGVLRYYARWG